MSIPLPTTPTGEPCTCTYDVVGGYGRPARINRTPGDNCPVHRRRPEQWRYEGVEHAHGVDWYVWRRYHRDGVSTYAWQRDMFHLQHTGRASS